MSVENVNTSYSAEVACMLKEHTNISDHNISCSQTSSQSKDKYGSEHQRSAKNAFSLSGGDILISEENDPCNNISKAKENCEKLGGPITGDEQRFMSILDRRRLAKKDEEKIDCEWKETTSSNDESVKQKVSDLLCRLKKEFSERKQARKQQSVNVTDNAKRVWNNSVDAFLRHHEKPKVDIRYSESSGDQPGKGVYTFAVRPSKIKKRETPEETKFDKVLQNTKQKTRNVEVPIKCDVNICEEKNHYSTYEMSGDVSSTQSGDETLNGDVNGYQVPLCYKTPLILDTFYNHTIKRLRKINEGNIVNGTATSVRQEDFNVSPVLTSNMKSFLLMYTIQRSAKNYRHIHMVTPTYNSERSEHNIRQICNAMVPGLFNVYTQSALPFYGLPKQEINGHAVPPDKSRKRLICNNSIPSYSKLKPEISIDNALHDTATISVHGYFHQHIPVFTSSKGAFLEQRAIPICKTFTFSDVSADKDIPADIAACYQDTTPTKALFATAFVSRNTEPQPGAASENETLCIEIDTLSDETVMHANISSHKQTSSNTLPSTSPFKELTTAEGNTLTEQASNHETSNENITETTFDEFDDDSPFGILSVFCRSAIHSGYSSESEAEI